VVLVGKGVYYTLICVALLLLLAPIIIIVAISFNPGEVEAFPPTGFSLRWYFEFFQSDTFVHSFFFVSLPIAVIVAMIATLLGVMAGYVLVRRAVPFRDGLQSLLLAPLIIPAVISGFALLLFFSRYDLQMPYVNLVIGHTLITVPYTTLTSMTSIYGMDDEVEEASRILGASGLETFVYVTLPLIKSGVIAGFLLAFIISFTDIYIALFLSGGNTVTLPLAIFQFLQWETSPIISAISTIQIVLILVVILVISRFVGFEQAFTQ
jgi:putative spermidine/putrescine transport system permease protein